LTSGYNLTVGERSWYLAGRTAGVLLRLWRTTIRVENRNSEVRKPPYVLALWHGRVIPNMMDNYDCRSVTMASRSNDGALAAGIVDQLGLIATRGSNSRSGKEALTEMEEKVRAREAPFAALTVDGPRGPWRKVKVGIVSLARHLQVPVIPITSSCRRAWVLDSWDHMVLPKPFTTVVVAYGEPWTPERLAGPLPQVLSGIAADLDALTAALDREVAGRELWPRP
jgi:lysophospholipid acyltransferase (LPLAT)-like uncharacterized protein